MASSPPTTLPDFMVFNEEFQFIICKIHRTAIHPSKIRDHLTHHLTDHEIDKNRFLESFQPLALQPLQIIHRNIKGWEPIQPISGLPGPRPAFACLVRGCSTLALNQQKIKNHVSQNHRIFGAKNQRVQIGNCLVQALEGPRYLFQIHRPASDLASPGSDGIAPSPKRPRVRSASPNPPDLAAQFLANHRAKQRSVSQKDRVFRAFGSRDETSSFHNETQYPFFLNGRDLAVLADLFLLEPDQPDQAHFLLDSIHYILVKGHRRINQTSSQALMALNGLARNQGPDSMRKFRPLQNQKTVEHYASVFRALLIFLINSFRFQQGSSEGPESIHCLYTLSRPSYAIISALKDLLGQVKPSPRARSSRQSGWHDGLGNDIEDSDIESDLDRSDSSEADNQDWNPRARPFSSPYPMGQINRAAALIQSLTLQLIEQPLKNPRESPIYAFLACFSRDYSHGCFKDISHISHIYSAVIKCCQFIFLIYLHEEIYPDQPDDRPASNPDPTPAVPMADYISEWMSKFFTGQSESPMGVTLGFRNLALFLIRYDSGLGQVTLVRPHEVRFKHLQVSQALLQQFFTRACITLGNRLARELCLDRRVFQSIRGLISLPEAAGYENIHNHTQGFNFGSNHPQKELFDRFLLKTTLSRGFQGTWYEQTRAHDRPALELKHPKVRDYAGKASSFLKDLLVLCHMTSGGPARGSEITQILFQNTAGTQRNLFLHPEPKLFVIRLAYSKTFSRTGIEKDALRVVPSGVSWLLLFYLLIVEPFLRSLLLEVNGAAFKRPEFLWLNFRSPRSSPRANPDDNPKENPRKALRIRPLDGRALSAAMRAFTNTVIGQPIGVGAWRHLAQALIRHSLGDAALEDPEADLDLEGLGAMQMHHSRQTGLMVYGRQNSAFSKLGSALQAAQMEFSRRWHIYLGLGPTQLDLVPCLSAINDPFPVESIPVSLPDPRVPILPLESPLVQYHMPRMDQNPAISTRPVTIGQFHRFLSLYPAPDVNALGDKSEFASPDLDQSQVVRMPENHSNQAFQDPDLLLHLWQEFMQSDQVTFFSPEQAQALHLFLSRVPYLIMILPTAGGKTTLFLLGASLATSRTTILVAPLVALKQDLHQKALKLGLSVGVYEELPESTPEPNPSRILLISIESVATPAFFSYAKTLMAKNQLDHVIFDECHLIPLAKNYRKVMNRIRQVTCLPAPMVFASATLPSHLETDLLQTLGLMHPVRIRANINQPSLFYGVKKLPAGVDLGVAALRLIRQFSERYPDQKTIVFCMSKRMVEEIHREHDLLTAFFHADLPDADKKLQLHSFVESKKQILVATSAIGAGYDFHDIGLVIHLQGAHAFTDFMQESGRASRKPGALGFSYTLARASDFYPRDSDSFERTLFRDYLNEKLCRRRPIFRVFNDQALEFCLDDWQACDLCRIRNGQFQDVIQGTTAYYSQVTAQFPKIVESIHQWMDDRCLICFWRTTEMARPEQIRNYPGFFDHGTLHCQITDLLIEEFDRNRPYLRLVPDSGCFHCLLPTKICSHAFKNHEAKGLLSIFRVLMFEYFDEFRALFPAYFGSKTKRGQALPFYQQTVDWQWGPLDTEVMNGTILFFDFIDWFNQE